MMRHKQSETRHMFTVEKPENVTFIDGVSNSNLASNFIHWLEHKADEDVLKTAMMRALPNYAEHFVTVFINKRNQTTLRDITVAWQETPERVPVHFGEQRPPDIHKYTVSGSVSYMLTDEVIANLVTMLPPEKK